MHDELSEQAKTICARHYNFKSRSSCLPCPLISECHKPCQAHTQEALSSWRERINRLAAQQ
ncbi:hypothetical protein [Pseudomonas leptonychotis]|uniref:hypothetical protein n=1 Tax=Pseudomonas leptonychotis TaxID=2448482 RepID=UPI003867E476